MRTKELLERLKGEISPEEWELLGAEPCAVPVSAHNRRTLLSMKRMTDTADREIEESRVEELRRRLSAYLDLYMPKQPDGHKWIILASLFLTFIMERPMHPMDIVPIRVEAHAGKQRYVCPCKSSDEDSVCFFCVCRPALKER